MTPLFPPVEGFVSPARGHWALVLLAEMSFEFTDEISRHLPVVLQQVFLGLDSSNKLVFRHCRMLILNTIRMMIIGVCVTMMVVVCSDRIGCACVVLAAYSHPSICCGCTCAGG